MMPEKNKKEHYYEWACRVLLTFHLWLSMSGYISYLQAKYRLISPLIPESTIRAITAPGMYTGLCMGGTFLAAIWFYFFRRKIITVIVSSLSLLAYEGILLWFTS